MKAKFKKLLSSLLIASTASLMSAAKQAPELSGNWAEPEQDEFKKLIKQNKKLLLKPAANQTFTLVAHASHSSHRSHTSHRSSSTSTKKSEKKNANDSTKVKNNYKLGERILFKGQKGSDVQELGDMLVTLGYLDKTKIYYEEGYPVYDTAFIAAIKKFQSGAGLPADGVCGKSTLKALLEQVNPTGE